MQFDPVQLGFTFAKELATQLITLSTGLIGLSVTFSKDLIKTPSRRSQIVLGISWTFHVFSILGGVWALMALTGTLMPLQPRAPGTSWAFAWNVRAPAMVQILLFLLGTILMLVAYFLGSAKPKGEEFTLVTFPRADLATKMDDMKKDQWEYVGFSTQGAADITVLLKRSRP